ncbi:uncharacterized protein N7473_006816 [Penicillium subrubescens]|uniref:uncharacterized protein n=1 Tax=Penicillium subrubescens TaxID=1316194 RepID=UPI002545A519|nr:uncharacterized protein N7473_006816 [Penicillium subrubescens]KAJ5890588.1 hypothetical protein N7473_006816 [Penicillium subrubescens]
MLTIPFFGDPRSQRGGVNRFIIKGLYRRILPILITNEDINNGLIYTAYIIREALAEVNIEVIEWPSYWPDLNLIENL